MELPMTPVPIQPIVTEPGLKFSFRADLLTVAVAVLAEEVRLR